MQSFALIDRLKRYYGCGIWAGKLFCLCVVVDYLLFVFLEIFAPRTEIDIARIWPKKPALDTQASDAGGVEIGRKRSGRRRERPEG